VNLAPFTKDEPLPLGRDFWKRKKIRKRWDAYYVQWRYIYKVINWYRVGGRMGYLMIIRTDFYPEDEHFQ
jgi:hypothetical protein